MLIIDLKSIFQGILSLFRGKLLIKFLRIAHRVDQVPRQIM
jgi:hypothetical protein